MDNFITAKEFIAIKESPKQVFTPIIKTLNNSMLRPKNIRKVKFKLQQKG